MTSNNIDWNDVIKKEARGNNDEDFGEVHDIQGNYVLVQRGIIDKEKFYIPKDQAESYDGDVLRFRISQEDLDQYQHEPPSIWDSDSAQETPPYERDTNEERIPLSEEKLDVSKKSQENQARVTKKPVTESKTVEVPLKREEAQVSKKPYVKEEAVIKKKAYTDTKEITEDVTSEELDTSNVDKEY
jgi:uncharacterized protein (TIGR02271 family)